MEHHGAKAAYAAAAEHYRQGRHGDALLLLDELAVAYPHDPAIQSARARCLDCLRRGADASDTLSAAGTGTRGHRRFAPAAGGKGRRVVAGAALALALAAGAAAYLLPHSRGATEAPIASRVPEPPAGTPAPAATSPLALAATDKKIRYDIGSFLPSLDSPVNREEAYALLLRGCGEEDLPDLHQTYGALRTGPGRWRAIRILAEIGSHTSVPLLRAALETDESLYVRRTAAAALGKIGSKTSMPALQNALLNDPERSVRIQSGWAIDQIQGREAAFLLRQALSRESDEGVRIALRWLLDYDLKGTIAPRIVPGEAQAGVFEDTQYRVYVPSAYTETRRWPLLVSVHGTDGHADPYVDMWRQDAERYGFVVLAPHFDSANFPNYDYITLDRDRSDRRLLDIITALQGELSIDGDNFYLFGHSKGGQFVSRFALLHPNRIRMAAACGSGNYVVPDPDTYFPEGIKPHPLLDPAEQLDFAGMLGVPLAIVVGTEELNRRKHVAIEFKRMVRNYAREQGVDERTQVILVDGGDHLGAVNQGYASAFFFGG